MTARSGRMRSTNRPTHGANPYIPAMWTAMTYGEEPAWWWSRMCGGVIVMTATMLAWATIIDASPSCTIRERWMTTQDLFTDLIGCTRLAVGSMLPGKGRGSARKPQETL